MMRILVLLCLSSLAFSCADFDSELPLPTNSGIAFISARDTAVYIDTLATPTEEYIFYDECLNGSWNVVVEIDPEN